MIDPALVHLTKQLMVGGARTGWRKAQTPAGAAMALFFVGTLAISLGPTLAMGLMTPIGETPMGVLLASGLPLLLYVVVVFSILSDAGQKILELRPPELQFVLAGPFTNSQILTYRLLTVLSGWFPMSLIFAIALLPYTGGLLGGWIGIFSSGTFVFLLAFSYTLIKPAFATRVDKLVRFVLLGGLLAIGLEVVCRVEMADFDQILASVSAALNEAWSARIFGVVFLPFSHLICRPLGPETLVSFALAAGLICLAGIGCYRCNTGFAELAVEGVARRVKKMERLRGGNVSVASGARPDRERSIPQLPWMAGVGPVAWVQLTAGSRKSWGLVRGVIVLGIFGAVGLAIYQRRHPDVFGASLRTAAVPIALGASTYLGFIVSMTAQLGFSTSDRVLNWYRTLPVPAFQMSIGMLAGLLFMLTGFRVGFFLPAIVVTNLPWHDCVSLFVLGFAADAALASSVNLVTVATGLRPMPDGAPDIFQGVRAMIFLFVVGFATLPSIFAGSVAAGVAGAWGGFSWTPCAAGAAIGMLALQPAICWATGTIFERREGV